MVEGTEVTAAAESDLLALRRETVGVIPEDFGLLPLLTAAENVGVPLRIARVDPAERERRVAELLDRVGLEKHANQRPDEMSGGQQQRVAVARALANRPKVLLADEPTAQLDSEAGARVMALLVYLGLLGDEQGNVARIRSGHLGHVEVGEHHLHLLDVVDPRAELGGDPVADASGGVTGGLQGMPAVEDDGPDHPAGSAVHHQAGTAEAVHVLEAGEDRHLVGVDRPVGHRRFAAEPGEPGTGAVGCGVVAVHRCYLPLVHLAAVAAHALFSTVPEGHDSLGARSHGVLGLPGGRRDATTGVPVGQQRHSDASVHVGDRREDFVTNDGDAVIDLGGIGLHFGGTHEHGALPSARGSAPSSAALSDHAAPGGGPGQ